MARNQEFEIRRKLILKKGLKVEESKGEADLQQQDLRKNELEMRSHQRDQKIEKIKRANTAYKMHLV